MTQYNNILVFSEILKEVKQTGEIHLVVDCRLERIGQLFKVENRTAVQGRE